MKGLEVGKVIHTILGKECQLDVFPIIKITESPYTIRPLLTYRRVGLNRHNSKDGYYSQSVQMEITVYTTGYEESISTANKVVDTLIRKRDTEINDIHLIGIDLIDASEEYSDDVGVYIQNLTFNIKIEK